MKQSERIDECGSPHLFIPFDSVFGSQPTPAITLRKIDNCDVAHFAVDCRRAIGAVEARGLRR
jgi:hypothetical protein